ncbi:MAG: DUF1080 domain-containing protein [Acidobacteria bacterium]|nr:DUF1080 domain-containing protein [Acidobacteriota bacterium]
MKRASLLLAASVLSLAAYYAAQDSEEGFIVLHDGDSHYGWTPEGNAWAASKGIAAADGGSAGLLRSNTPFADFLLRFEVRAEKTSNAVLYVHAARDGAPKESGYAIQLGGGDSDWPYGSIVSHAKAGGGGLAAGGWIPVEVEASGGNLTVRSSGKLAASAAGLQSAPGFFILEARRGGRVELRGLRVRPLNGQSLFNGSDLSGWKSTGSAPKQGGNVITKMFGKGKPKEAKWTVGKGGIHAADGPGQLESLLQYGDFILQADVRINGKKGDTKRRYALLLRGDPGQLGSGYEVNIQPGATGAVMGLTTARKNLGAMNQFAALTVAARARHIQVWVDGAAVSDLDDVRPEGTNPKKDARTAPGVIAFYSPEDDADLDLRNIHITQLPKTFGHAAPKKTDVAAPVAPQLPQMPAAAAPQAGGDAQARILQQQLQEQQIAQMKQDQKQQKSSQLLQQALRSNDPAEQVGLYDQILMLDPNNQVAFNGRKDAQAKLDQKAQQAAQQAEESSKQAASEQEKQMTLAGSIQAAEAAFLAGNLGAAEQALNAAERVAPDNMQVKALRSRLDLARQRKDSVFGLMGAGAGVALLGGLGWLLMAGRRKDPYLEITDGIDKGKRYNIDKEMVMLGAIAEDGGAKNDVVLRDAERMISRFHAQIHFKEGKLYVVDTNSYNGTFVDKKRLEPGKPLQLKGGARVSFAGTCTIKVGFEKRKKGQKG